MKHFPIFFIFIFPFLLINTLHSQFKSSTQSNIEQQFSSEEKNYLEWALTGRGKKNIVTKPAQILTSRGSFDPDSSGSPYTEDIYFKNWFSPYEILTPELQLKAFSNTKKTLDEKDIEPATNALASKWTQTGPYGMRVYGSSPAVYFSGRVTGIAFNPTTGLHVTSGSGGLFGRAVGLSIFPLADKLPSLIGGSVAVHPNDPDMIFFGSGEYGRRAGTGLYKTVNGGATWTQPVLSPVPTQIQKILIAPWDASIVFAATDVGLFRSTDYGDTWTAATTWNCSDIAASSVGSVMLAGRPGWGVFRSSDYGVTWYKLNDGLPTLNIGRVSITIAPSNINRAFVQIAGKSPDTLIGVYRTDDLFFPSQPSWTNVSPNINYMPRQGGIHNAITVHPTNYNIVWAGGVKLIRSSDGGNSWIEIGTNSGQVHSDIKTFLYRTSDNLLYLGCDGGLFFTDDEGVTWNSQINQLLPITQFYNIHVAYTDERVKYGGAQDNGISGTSVEAPTTWTYQVGGDGVDAAVDYDNLETVFSTDGLYLSPLTWLRRKSTNAGADWNTINTGITETTPWAAIYINQDLTRPSYLYTNAGKNFFYTTNGGTSWLQINTSTMPGDAKYIVSNSTGTFLYCCTSNSSLSLTGFEWIGGQTPWKQKSVSSGLPTREVKRVVPSLTNSDRAYAIINGVGDDKKIYKSTNRGQNWTNITNDLADIAVNDLVENPYNSNVLYLGTQSGMFKSTNGGTNWYQWNSGMPPALWVLDLEYAFSDDGDYIVAGTFGRSTFERKATGFNSILSLSDAVINFGTVVVGQTKRDSFYIRNLGDTVLTIASARSKNSDVDVTPSEDIAIPPGDSSWFYLTFTPGGGRENQGRYDGQIDFIHDGDGSPTSMSLTAYIGDDYQFRTFVPESLMVKADIRRKVVSPSWRFDFINSAQPQDPATILHVEFKQAVSIFDSISPFREVTQMDRGGKIWEFSDGFINYGESFTLWGKSKSKSQEVKKWYWVVYNETRDTLHDLHGKLFATERVSGLAMPNTANLRKEIFKQVPFNRANPMIIGKKDLSAKTLKIAYVSFAMENNFVASLIPGRSQRSHDQSPRYFDFYNNGKEMIGSITKLTPDNQQNSLFAQLMALKINIYGSALGKMPVGFGELKYNDASSRFDGMMIKEIDSLANYYITYGDSTSIGSATELDSILTLINGAFVGPIDTLSFHSGKLVLTGVKSIGEVEFLVRDTSIQAFTITPNQMLEERPQSFQLSQNYPNPFNPTTSINFAIPEYSDVSLTVFNILGQVVASPIVHEEFDAGNHEIVFDASNLPSGIYFYRLNGQTISEEGDGEYQSSLFTGTMKMLLVR